MLEQPTDIVRARAPFIAKKLLEEWSSGREPFVDEREYAAANASAGLNIFVLHNGILKRWTRLPYRTF